jgi:hypothetical protein
VAVSLSFFLMSAWLIAFVGLVYLWISVENFWRGNVWMGVVFFGYSLSNVGLYKLAVLTGAIQH